MTSARTLIKMEAKDSSWVTGSPNPCKTRAIPILGGIFIMRITNGLRRLVMFHFQNILWVVFQAIHDGVSSLVAQGIDASVTTTHMFHTALEKSWTFSSVAEFEGSSLSRQGIFHCCPKQFCWTYLPSLQSWPGGGSWNKEGRATYSLASSLV